MPSLKDLKIRIESVKSTRKITKAMQMVAAAKLRRAQEAAENARPYSERLANVMSGLAASAQDSPSAPAMLAGTGKSDTYLLIAATAERGLCGGFNSSIIRMVKARARELIKEGKTVKILTIGKKGREQLKREFEEAFVGHVDLSGHRRVGSEAAEAIAAQVRDMFATGEFDVAVIFFSRFKSVISQEPTARQLIPLQFEEAAGGDRRFYNFEPAEADILDELLPKAVSNQVFSALLENAASEQGARMSAMDNATRNAGDMIDKLTIVYNRSRQAAITKELIEIISGAEAL
ncbi:MAG: F0F1 ATP synthase subunit gamma [Rhodobacteraceae bacterium]|nr:F0F1 ATP synthase subunit gamma [Paracoccaceae bacterium]